MKLPVKEVQIDVTKLATDDPGVRADILRKAQERNERQAAGTWDRYAEERRIKRWKTEFFTDFILVMALLLSVLLMLAYHQ